MLYVVIAIAAFVAAGYLIVKKVHAAAAIFFVGVVLLMLSAILGKAGKGSVEIDPSSGSSLYDQLLVVEKLFEKRFAGIGMAIMVLFGFVSYMRHIGADAKTVVVLSRPLQKLHGSYWMVPVGFLVGNLLSLVVPSASALSLLLIATLLPAMVAAGLTPLTVGAVVVTCSTIMPTPLEAGLILGSELTEMQASEFVFGHVAKATIPTLIITAFVHMFWQRYCDQRDLARAAKVKAKAVGGTAADKKAAADSAELKAAQESQSSSAIDDAIKRAAKLPGFYAILPLLPLLLILVTAILERLHVLPFEAEILPVTVVSLFIAMIIEAIRHRNFTNSLDQLKTFFKGMGEGAAGVVALLVAAAILVEGINQLGVITMLTESTAGSKGAAAMIIIIFVISTALMASLTGSGTAPYFAFAEVVPSLAADSGVLPVRMLTSIWGTSNLMRQVSPVCAAVLIVAGAIKVSPFQLVKRTSVPMITATVLNVILSFVMIHA